jgi:predicted nuclease of predicted toxin-antitoxin system
VLRFAADENFNNDIIRAAARREPSIDILRAQDAGLSGADDETILAWATGESRVLLTHDVNTVTRYAYERVDGGQSMPGVVEIRRGVSICDAVEDLLLLAVCSDDGEWEGQILYIPLQ